MHQCPFHTQHLAQHKTYMHINKETESKYNCFCNSTAGRPEKSKKSKLIGNIGWGQVALAESLRTKAKIECLNPHGDPKKRPPRFAEKTPASVVLYDFWHTSGVLYCQHICQLCSFQLYKIKFYIYTVSKKHVTMFSKISLTRTVCLQRLLSDLLHVFLVSHLTYLVQLRYHGKLSRTKYHEFSIKLPIFRMLQNQY